MSEAHDERARSLHSLRLASARDRSAALVQKWRRGEGFEPPIRFPVCAPKHAALDHSATPPWHSQKKAPRERGEGMGMSV
jgi:hypothetical protein